MISQRHDRRRAGILRYSRDGAPLGLGREGVGQLVLEHRDEAGDRLDRRTRLDVHHSGLAEMSYRFATAREEPLLWAADAVAGARPCSGG